MIKHHGIARIFNISENIIGLTIVALGTSFPELIVSIVAVKKNNSEVALGNIIGSNILNLLLVLGITSIIKPIFFSTEYNMHLFLLFIITMLIILFKFIGKKSAIGKFEGILFLTTFIFYNINVIK